MKLCYYCECVNFKILSKRINYVLLYIKLKLMLKKNNYIEYINKIFFLFYCIKY